MLLFQVKCWGRNNYGQLGLSDTNNRGDNAGEMADSLAVVQLGAGRTAKEIVAGGHHNCAILDNNQVECWGCANYCLIFACITSLVVCSAACSVRVAFEVSETCRVVTCVSLYCLRNTPCANGD